jgi:hypothetical protein
VKHVREGWLVGDPDKGRINRLLVCPYIARGGRMKGWGDFRVNQNTSIEEPGLFWSANFTFYKIKNWPFAVSQSFQLLRQ